MDIVQQCLSLTSVPCLLSAFSAFKFIWSDVEQAQISKTQLEALAQSIAQLLLTLDVEYRVGRLQDVDTSVALADLCRLIDEISAFAQKQASSPFLKLLFTKNQRIAHIDGYYRRMKTSIVLFELSTLLNIHAWQSRADNARVVDQRLLNERLLRLEKSRQRLKDAIYTQDNSVMTMIVSLQRRLDLRSDGDRELHFFSHVLRYLTTTSGIRVELQNWMITSYEVEFGPKIASGGFGQVFIGTWNNTQVALKVLATDTGLTPSSTAIRQEIETWSMLKHTHILQFLGANEFDNRPFIVMPYMKNGNARNYARANPDCNRLRILHHISLGLVYLHSQKVVHGDLKALNVLVDSSGKAVLCDFGLSRIKADATSRTIARSDGDGIMGSRNWMAPELLLGGSLKKPCDIYAFGMTLFEICANEIPLGHINDADFVPLILERNVRPERPDYEDAPQLSDAVWEVAEKCWVKDPKQRPTASTLCDTLSHLLGTTAVIPPMPISASSPSIIMPQSIPQPPTHGQATPPRGLTPLSNVSHFLDTTSIAQALPDPSPSRPIVLPDAPVQASPPRPLTPPPNLTIRGHTSEVYSATFSPDGKYIVSGSVDNTVRVWDAQTGHLALGPLKMHTSSVYCVAFSPDGRRIASGSSDRTILVWDAVTGKVVAGPFKGHTDYVWCISFSPNGKQIASGCCDHKIWVWDAWTGDLLIHPLAGHTGGVSSVTFSGDSECMASGSSDNTVRVWDVKSGRLVHGPLRGHTNLVRFVAFSPNGKRIVSASWDGNVCVWDADTGALVSGPSKRHAEGTLAVVFAANSTYYCPVSPDGKWIAGTDIDSKTIYIWDSMTGGLAATFTEQTECVLSVSFSPDNKRILSSSDDKTIRVCTLNL